ncbi:MAG TPA: YbaK/EbsC family protein [Actinomycetota bacterium]
MRTSVDVHNHLVDRGVQHELLPLRGRLRSAERISAVLGLPPEVVGKVVVFETDGGPVAALVPSSRDADPVRVRRAIRASEIHAASPAKASQLSEYLFEAIPPVGLPPSFKVVMDRRLASQEVLYFAGGEATAILKVRAEDLAGAADAKLARIATAQRRAEPSSGGP